ncbi:RrF2 family transcriptional regulator [Pararhizobium sp.]|uniref:RrF2 family transcriptional regulator n=1 Tax=Pararhizobium sp. TaxID=1977563 RepID=UPI003D13150E
MKLRSQVEHGLLCCLLMTTLEENETLSTSALAKICDLPKPYLSKTLQALARAGVIIGSQGTYGGYRLVRKAPSITLLEIVQAIEGEIKTFANCGLAEKIVPAGSIASVASIIERSFNAADSLWQDVLAANNLESLARELNVTPAGLPDFESTSRRPN